MNSNEIDTDFVAEMNAPMGHTRTLGPCNAQTPGQGRTVRRPSQTIWAACWSAYSARPVRPMALSWCQDKDR